MKKLTVEQVLRLHKFVVSKTGGADLLRDEGLLSGAVNQIYLTFDGKDLYPSLIEKAARLCFAIAAAHPFLDGNKRAGVLSALVLLKLGGVNPPYTDEDVVRIGLKAAHGTYEEVLDLFRAHV